jgi:hypothetical protein
LSPALDLFHGTLLLLAGLLLLAQLFLEDGVPLLLADVLALVGHLLDEHVELGH